MAAIDSETTKDLVDMLAKFTDQGRGVAAAGGVFLSQEGACFTAVSGSPKEESETVFSAASISKLFVGVAVMQCVEDTLIRLDDDAGSHLPAGLGSLFRNPNHPEDPVTVEMLLTHTSSLRDSEMALTCGSEFRTDGGDPCPITLVEYFQRRFGRPESSNLWSKSCPGRSVHYSNAGFTVLGLLVEHVRGMPFAQVVAERIFARLNMTRSSFSLKDALATGAEVLQPRQRSKTEYYEVAEYPAAQLRSTASDLLKFLRTFTREERPNSPILSVGSIEQMLRARRAFAWWAPDFPYNSGIGAFEHGGCMEGVRSYCFLWKTGALVVLHNTDSTIERDASYFAFQLKRMSS